MFSIITTAFVVGLMACEVPAELPKLNSEVPQILQLVNNLRASGCECGSQNMPPVARVEWSELLEKTALQHSQDMNDNNYFNHKDSNGLRADSRLTNNGYPWSSFGENIYFNSDPSHTVLDAFEAWKASPGHCKNMMEASFTEMGVAQENGYWTQVFASK